MCVRLVLVTLMELFNLKPSPASRSTLPFPGSQAQYEVSSVIFHVSFLNTCIVSRWSLKPFEGWCSGHVSFLPQNKVLEEPTSCGFYIPLIWFSSSRQVFIKELVWNLFGEGNDVFREGDWTKSIEMYTEALSIAEYADSEDICVPISLLEKLYANRAAAYLNIVPVGNHFPLVPSNDLHTQSKWWI